MDLFYILYLFYTDNDLEWIKLISVSTDGAPSMLGITSGLIKLNQR